MPVILNLIITLVVKVIIELIKRRFSKPEQVAAMDELELVLKEAHTKKSARPLKDLLQRLRDRQ